MMRWWFSLVLVLATIAPVAAEERTAPPTSSAKDEEFNVEFFYPLVTRRPVIEREFEFKANHAKGDAGRLSDFSAAIELPVLPRWQVELTLPFGSRDPRDGSSQAGVGDIEIEQKFQLLKSIQPRGLLAVGFELRLPTGSERRGLGGEFVIEPFITGGFGIGSFEVLGDVAWDRNLNANVEGPHEQQLSAGAAGAWILSRYVVPLIELRTQTTLRGGEESARGLPRVTLVPGFNSRIAPGTPFRLGIELPVSRTRDFDYAVRAGLVHEF